MVDKKIEKEKVEPVQQANSTLGAPLDKSESGFVTKKELENFGDKLFTKVSDLFKQQTDVHSDTIGQGRVLPGYEIGQDARGIEPVSLHDFVDQTELENFMNQMVEIYIHPSPNKEDNPVIVPNVNGVNQPIIRGQRCRVRRKFVEALARNRYTRYDQVIDPFSPDKYDMRPDVTVRDPFTVTHDPHPRGAEWLQALLAEA